MDFLTPSPKTPVRSLPDPRPLFTSTRAPEDKLFQTKVHEAFPFSKHNCVRATEMSQFPRQQRSKLF